MPHRAMLCRRWRAGAAERSASNISMARATSLVAPTGAARAPSRVATGRNPGDIGAQAIAASTRSISEAANAIAAAVWGARRARANPVSSGELRAKNL